MALRGPPSVLPVLYDPDTLLGVHLRPGRALEASPWVSADRDAQEYKFVAADLAHLPRGLLVWAKETALINDQRDAFLGAIRSMAQTIRGAVPIEARHDAVFEMRFGQRWGAGGPRGEAAWTAAECGHPFLGMPWPGRMDEPDECLPQWEQALAARDPRPPELIALAVASRLEAGQDPVLDDVVAVLEAESWREVELGSAGWWRTGGSGVDLWDAVLGHLPDGFLTGTPFESLGAHPRAYSGTDAAGLAALVDVGGGRAEAGDLEGALTQLRNALPCGRVRPWRDRAGGAAYSHRRRLRVDRVGRTLGGARPRDRAGRSVRRAVVHGD